MMGSWRFWGVLYFVVIAWALWPIGSLLIANGVAAVLHCDLSRGGPSPCSLLGVDISHQLYGWATVFWLATFTLPTGVPLLAILIVSHLCLSIYRRVHRTR
jgi:hypothetical protein